MNSSLEPTPFRSHEVAILSDIIQAAYSDALSTDTWIRVLDVIRQLVPYDAAGAVFANVQTGQLDDRIYRNASPEFIRWYDEHYPSVMVIANDAQARGLGVWRSPEVIGKHGWEASDIRNGLLSNFGLNTPVCMTCGTASQLSARFWFIRKISKCDFADGELNLLKLLQPHFCEALRLAKAVFDGNSYREAFRQAVRPSFICDSSGKVMDTNIRGQELVKSGDGEDAAGVAQIETIAQRMISRQIDFLVADYAGGKCRFIMSPVHTPNAPTSYFLAATPPDHLRHGLTVSMHELGLSERETQVCLLVIRGMHNRDIAEKLFIAESTVKDHVTSLFGKLDVSSRSGMISRLLGF